MTLPFLFPAPQVVSGIGYYTYFPYQFFGYIRPAPKKTVAIGTILYQNTFRFIRTLYKQENKKYFRRMSAN